MIYPRIGWSSKNWRANRLVWINLKEVRNLKDVKWCAIEDGSPGKGIGQHIACFILEPK